MSTLYPERYAHLLNNPEKVMMQRWGSKEYLPLIMPRVEKSMPSSRQKADEPIEVKFPNEWSPTRTTVLFEPPGNHS